MKTLPALLLSIACCVLAASGAASAAPAATAQATTQAASDTAYALREVRIVAHGISPDQAALEEFIVRRGAELAREILHLPADNRDDWFRHEMDAAIRGDDVVTEYRLAVNLPARDRKRPAAAKEFLDALVPALDKFVRESFDRQRSERIEPFSAAKDEAEARVRDAETRASQLRAQMRQLSGRGDISGKTITDAMTRLEEEKQKLELDAMAKTARREALEKELATQGEKMQFKVDNDPIAAELEKVVKAREERMERTKQQASQGLASMTEASEAVAAAAEARAKLLERKRDASAEAGGDALAALNRELLTLSVDLRELEARRKFVESRLPGLRDAMDQLDAWTRAENELQDARAELSKANSALRDMNRQLAGSKPPQIVVLKSEDRARRPDSDKMFPATSVFGGPKEPEPSSPRRPPAPE